MLQGEEARLKLAGQAALDSGYNVAINGSLYLNALLGYLPFLDDMNGIVLADVIVHSEGQTPFTSSPSLAGNAQLRDGDLAIESLKLTLEAVDGDLTLVGDVITIDDESHEITLKVSDEELAVRAEQWVAPPFKATSGTLWKYIRLVEDASNGCVTDG